MHDDVVVGFEFEMRDVEFANRVQRRGDRPFAFGATACGPKLALDLSQCAQHPGAIEALAFTMFAEAHGGILHGGWDEAAAAITRRHYASPWDSNPC